MFWLILSKFKAKWINFEEAFKFNFLSYKENWKKKQGIAKSTLK